MIVAFSGGKSSGKDTAYDFIKEFLPNSPCFSFAKPLKKFCVEVLGLHPSQVYGSEEDKSSLTHLKWEDFPTPVFKLHNGQIKAFRNGEYEAQSYDYGLQTLCSIKSIDVRESPKLMTGYMTARHVQQFFATEVCRQFDPDCFVRAAMKEVDDYIDQYYFDNWRKPVVFFNDLRFCNEAHAVHARGGKVIRFGRKIDGDTHSSECELDHTVGYIDAYIDNENMTVSQKNEAVYSILKGWGVIK